MTKIWSSTVPSSWGSAFCVTGILAWLLTLWLGVPGALLAGLVAGGVAPRRGAFVAPALGAFTAWLVWFLVSSATAPLLPLGRILASIMGLPALGGFLLPLVACLLAAVIAGLAASGVKALARPRSAL